MKPCDESFWNTENVLQQCQCWVKSERVRLNIVCARTKQEYYSPAGWRRKGELEMELILILIVARIRAVFWVLVKWGREGSREDIRQTESYIVLSILIISCPKHPLVMSSDCWRSWLIWHRDQDNSGCLLACSPRPGTHLPSSHRTMGTSGQWSLLPWAALSHGRARREDASGRSPSLSITFKIADIKLIEVVET